MNKPRFTKQEQKLFDEGQLFADLYTEIELLPFKFNHPFVHTIQKEILKTIRQRYNDITEKLGLDRARL